MQARYLIIINPHANNGKSRAIWQLIQSDLDASQINYQYRITEYHNHARLITEQYLKNYYQDDHFNNILLVIGGDGTLNQVIGAQKNAIIANQQLKEFPIALIPTGKNNNFALEMGISVDWQKTLQRILYSTHFETINLGFYFDNINQHYQYFLNNMGIGFESNLLSSQSNHHKWKIFRNRFTKLKHFWSILVNLYAIKEFPLSIAINQKQAHFEKVVWLCIYNTPYFNNNKKIMPNASIKKDSLSVVIIENKNILLVTWAILLMFMGKRSKLKMVHSFDCDNLTISIPSIEYGNIDDEELGGRFYNARFGITSFRLIS